MVIETTMAPVELLKWQLQRVVFDVDVQRQYVSDWDDDKDKKELEVLEATLMQYKDVFQRLGLSEIYDEETKYLNKG